VQSLLEPSKGIKLQGLSEEAAAQTFGRVFGFAFVWALGGNLAGPCREDFDTFVREHLQLIVSFPSAGLVWDYQLSTNTQPPVLKPWSESVPAFSYNKAVPYFQVGGAAAGVGWCHACVMTGAHEISAVINSHKMKTGGHLFKQLFLGLAQCASHGHRPYLCLHAHGARCVGLFLPQMLVPTVDTMRFSSMLELCLDVNRSVLFTGDLTFGRPLGVPWSVTGGVSSYSARCLWQLSCCQQHWLLVLLAVFKNGHFPNLCEVCSRTWLTWLLVCAVNPRCHRRG
jgi:hypothetical protein